MLFALNSHTPSSWITQSSSQSRKSVTYCVCVFLKGFVKDKENCSQVDGTTLANIDNDFSQVHEYYKTQSPITDLLTRCWNTWWIGGWTHHIFLSNLPLGEDHCCWKGKLTVWSKISMCLVASNGGYRESLIIHWFLCVRSLKDKLIYIWVVWVKKG